MREINLLKWMRDHCLRYGSIGIAAKRFTVSNICYELFIDRDTITTEIEKMVESGLVMWLFDKDTLELTKKGIHATS
jgi:hypothetical protein